MTKNYWAEREAVPSSGIGSALKRSPLTRKIVGVLYSLRAADEAFVAGALNGKSSVLDVACGSGKPVIPATVDYVAGADITGYPKRLALQKGYRECVSYDAPDYAFSISREVDAITAINLNAHVPFASYETIIRRALSFLRPGGSLILVNEYDNDGLSYRLMKRDRPKFERFVAGMEHWHLEGESSFLARFRDAFPNLKLTKRKPLIRGILPAVHYHAYLTEREPSAVENAAMLLADLPLSLANSAQSGATDRCFLVGYEFS